LRFIVILPWKNVDAFEALPRSDLPLAQHAGAAAPLFPEVRALRASDMTPVPQQSWEINVNVNFLCALQLTTLVDTSNVFPPLPPPVAVPSPLAQIAA
jgi:hypothetical protein